MVVRPDKHHRPKPNEPIRRRRSSQIGGFMWRFTNDLFPKGNKAIYERNKLVCKRSLRCTGS